MSTGEPTGVTSPRAAFVLTLLGVLLVQAAWILALPAFHGIDEFDHVFKAEAVATGQLGSVAPATRGRGGLVDVPSDVVRAAGPVCASYDYTGPQNCRGAAGERDGITRVATAASRYNPAYYVVVGTLARPFTGAAVDYAMRVATAVTCAVLIAWAAALTARHARDAWPLTALLLAVTPVLTYSTVVAAPNGIQYAAALLVWAAGLGLVRAGRAEAVWLVPIAVGAVTMLVAHTTSPLWLLFTAVALTALRPLRTWADLAHSRPRAVALTVVTVVLTGVACVAWIMANGTNDPTDGPATEVRLRPGLLMAQVLLWLLQAVGAFPMRDQPAPTAVYALWLLPLLGLAVAGWRRGDARHRAATGVLVTGVVAVPVLLTMLTFQQLGTAWQGRYALPLYVGIALLAGRSLSGTIRVRRGHLALLGAMLAVAAGLSVTHVSDAVVVLRPGVAAAALVPGGGVLVGLLAALGTLVAAFASVGLGRSRVTGSPSQQTNELEEGVSPSRRDHVALGCTAATFDVLLPFYGDPSLMREAVRSVLAQSHQAWRLVVVDDGYPDASIETWFASLDDSRVCYHRNEVNLGANRNYTRALGLARADYVVVMGADDVMHPSYLQVVADGIERFPGVSVLECAVDVIDAEGRLVLPLVDRVKRLMTPGGRAPTLMSGEKLLVSLLRGNWTYFPSLCWRLDVVRSIGFRPDFHVVQDLGLLLDVLSQPGASMALLPQRSFGYRRHAGSDSALKTVAGPRFTEEKHYFDIVEGELRSRGLDRAARAARLHLTSRLHALALLPSTVQDRDLDGVRRLARHIAT